MRRWYGLSPVLLSVLLAGCSNSPGIPPLAAVKGKVELDGKPMATGKIAFVQAGIPQDLLDIKDGVFEGKAKVGKAKVEVYLYQPGKIPDMYKGKEMSEKDKEQFMENVIPAAYNSQSTLTAEITAGGPNDFSFPIKLK